MRLVCFILCFCAGILPLWAQESDTIDFEETETLDLSTHAAGDGSNSQSLHELIRPDALESTRAYLSEDLVIRKFDEKKWKEIVRGTDFKEEARETKAEGNRARGSSIPWAGPLLKFFSYVIIIGVVLLLLYMVLKNVTFDLKIKRTELQTQDIENGVDNIEDVDIQTLLERARTEGNFKIAVRLYYLGLLKKLHELNVIVWRKDKTNHDYLSELFAGNFYFQDIRSLTHSYEAVWYGQHPLQDETFRRLSGEFETIYQKINNPQVE